ncbi:para-aminobenzoate synthase glutamine amidotransferase component II [Vibrio cholerae RC385]|nr:para-aminobenzoate synthase glutamine amidotransferase component II [Vibrio cholerae RC385]
MRQEAREIKGENAKSIERKCYNPLRVLKLELRLSKARGVFLARYSRVIISMTGTLEQSSELLRVLKLLWICSSIRTVDAETNVRSSPCGASSEA